MIRRSPCLILSDKRLPNGCMRIILSGLLNSQWILVTYHGAKV
jgi:hypothetical protein